MRSGPGSDLLDNTLVVSFVGQTMVLSLRGEEVEETEIPGLAADQQTFYCGNVIGKRILQVGGWVGGWPQWKEFERGRVRERGGRGEGEQVNKMKGKGREGGRGGEGRREGGVGGVEGRREGGRVGKEGKEGGGMSGRR